MAEPTESRAIAWGDAVWDGDRLISPSFGDVYFSADGGAEGGIAQAEHVFLHGNRLPARFANPGVTTVGELGFGTGVTFLTACRAFLRGAHPEAGLAWVGFEKHPLSRAVLEQVHDRLWRDGQDRSLVEAWLASYPLAAWRDLGGLASGTRLRMVLAGGRITLTLVLGDIRQTLAGTGTGTIQQRGWGKGFEAWCLDGFGPRHNPAMWEPSVLSAVGRFSAAGATAATYSVAGAVRRGLSDAGFSVEKAPGYAGKREMLRAVRVGDDRQSMASNPSPMVTVLGAGLAGAWAARRLAERGSHVTVFDSGGVASGASGNPVGLAGPLLALEPTAATTLTSAGYRLLDARLRDEWMVHSPQLAKPTGQLHVAHDTTSHDRLARIAEQGAALGTELDWCEPGEADDHAGLALGQAGLWQPATWCVDPPALVRALLDHPRIESVVAAEPSVPSGVDGGITLYAGGPATMGWPGAEMLPLSSVRGQIVMIRATPTSAKLKTALSHVGYALPAIPTPTGAAHALGSTYAHHDLGRDVRAQDTARILAKLAGACPALHHALGPAEVVQARASVRATTPDRLPRVGWLHAESLAPKPCAVLTGLGSRGLCFAPVGAELLADMVFELPQAVDPPLAQRLRPALAKSS